MLDQGTGVINFVIENDVLEIKMVLLSEEIKMGYINKLINKIKGVYINHFLTIYTVNLINEKLILNKKLKWK